MSIRENQLLPQGALIEMQEGGGHVRVTAIDPVSGEEITAVGPATATKRDLEQLAIKKLMWKLEKIQRQNQARNPVYRKTRPAPSGWEMNAKPASNPTTSKFSRLVGDDYAKSARRKVIRKDPPSGWDL